MKLRNVRRRQRRRYADKHYDYCLKYKAKLILPWSVYNRPFTDEDKLAIKRWVRFFR